MNKKVAGITFSVIVLGFSAYLLMGRDWGGGADFATKARINGKCLACKRDVEAEYPGLEIAPYVCPHCKERAVFPKFFCVNCKKVFIPAPDKSSGQPRIPVAPKCTACGSTYVQGYYPGLDIQKPKGDGPLPKWP